MDIVRWGTKHVRNLDYFDIKLIKLYMFMFVLLLAKIFPILMAAPWWTYLLIGLVAIIRPWQHFFNR